MTNKKSDDITTMSVEDLLTAIKTSATGETTSKCILIRKIETLPDNVYQAILLAMSNEDVSNRDLVAFINGKTDVNVNMKSLQAHRAKKGCVGCLYGTSN